MYLPQNIVDRIKYLAKQQKIPLKDMLIECELNKNAISELSKGKLMSYYSLAKIADYLNCSVDYLLGRTDTPKGTLGDDLSVHEKKLIAAYRNKPNMQESIDKLLDISSDCIEADIIETIKSGEAAFAKKPTRAK